jgi:succinate dehydrogenase / fumarate reductase cytochrome b subunit
MSIVHRATGVIMVLGIPFLVYLLERSLSGPDGYSGVAALLSGLPGRIGLFLFFWALLHHLFAGVRYLLLDIDIGIEKPLYRTTAWVVLLAAPVSALLLLGVMS